MQAALQQGETLQINIRGSAGATVAIFWDAFNLFI